MTTSKVMQMPMNFMEELVMILLMEELAMINFLVEVAMIPL